MSRGLPMHRYLGFVAVGLGLAVARPAKAQSAGNITLDAFRPAMDSRGYLTLNASQTLGDKELSFGLGALDWGHDLLVLGDSSTCAKSSGQPCYSVNNMITATLVGAFGLKAGPIPLEFGVSLPIVIMDGDRGPNFVDPTNSNNDQSFGLSGQGIGNLGLHFKTHFLSTSRPPHLGIGVMASVYRPTMSPENRWLGTTGVTPEFIGIIDKEFGRRFRLTLNGGIRLHATSSFTNDDATDGGIMP